MRILYVITLAERGGAQVHVADLLRGFSAHGDIALGVGEDGYLCDVARELGIRVFHLPLVHPMKPITDLRAVSDLARTIRAWKPDLVHAHTSKAGMIARAAGFLMGTPVVFTAHTWSFSACFSWQQQAISAPLERLAGRVRGRIIAVSEANRNLAARHRISRPENIVTVWNGIADSPLRADPSRPGPARIVMVARFASQKDQALLVRALRNVPEEYELIFVGDGPNRAEVEAQARSLDRRVMFLGERADIAEILASADIMALATKWEGLPLSILEGMRAGLPVVASDVGGVSEAVCDGETGYLVPTGNETHLRTRLRQLIADPALRGQLGANGRRRYEAEFTLDTMLMRTAAVYRSAMPERKVEFPSLADQSVDQSNGTLS